VIQFFAPLAEGAGETIIPYEEDISALFLLALSQGDEFLVAATCKTINSIALTVPSFFEAKFADYMRTLIELAEQEDAIPTLETLFYFVNAEIDNTAEIVSALMEIAAADGRDPNKAIKCISACISRANPQNVSADLYPALREFLSTALSEDPSTNEAVYECFSNCCQIAPKAVVEDLQTIFGGMIELLTPETIDLVPNIAKAIQNFSRFYTASIQPFIPQCAELLIQFLVNDTKTTDVSSSDQQIQDAATKEIQLQSEILLCLASLISSFPEEMGQYMETVISFTCQWLTLGEESEDNIAIAADAVSNMSQGLHVIDVDPHPLVGAVLSALSSPSDVELVNNLFMALGALLTQVSEKLSEECVKQVTDFFTEVLEGARADFLEDTEIDKDIQSGFFFALKCFILSGLVTKVDLEKTIEVIHSKITDESKPQLIALANLALARILFVCPEGKDELASQYIQNTVTILSQEPKLNEVKSNLFSAVAFLATSHFSLFSQEYLEAVVGSLSANITDETEKVVKLNAALALLCIAANGVEIDITGLLTMMPPQPDEEDVALFARAAIALEQKAPGIFAKASVTLLASQDWVLSLLPQEIVANAIAAVQSQPEEAIDAILNGNEGYTVRMRSRLPQ
jgi:hypothetical protein